MNFSNINTAPIIDEQVIELAILEMTNILMDKLILYSILSFISGFIIGFGVYYIWRITK